MSYSIIRVQKMNGQAIKGIQIHNQREKESHSNPDIREADNHLNYDLIHGSKKLDYKKEIEKVISENVKSEKKIRKDAVRLSEFLITSDSAFFDNLSPDEQKRYFETAKDFIADKYGEQNIIYATVHNDEKTPHMHVGLVPVTDDGRLSAKDVFGNRLQFVKLQDAFNAHVKAHGFDLERGLSSNRKHLDVGRYKAKTAYEAEKEATQKYEQTLSKIKAIDEKTKAIEDLPEPTKMMGRVMIKSDDYETLINYATNGAVAEVEVVDLERKLAETKQEIETLKENAVKGQEKLRKSYYEIETESEKIQTNLEKLVDEKAETKARDIFNESDLVKENMDLEAKYTDMVTKHNEIVVKHNDVAVKYNALLPENEQQQEENQALKTENQSLREQIKTMQHDFEAWKERLVDVLNRQFARIKTLLNVNNIEPHHIKFLEEKKEKIVADSLKEMEKPKEKAKTQEMER